MTAKNNDALTPDEALRLKRTYLVPCVYHFYRDPPVIVAGEGCELIDHTGRRYLDCYSGVTVVNTGHCNPAITEATADQLRRLDHTTTIYLTEPMLRLAEALADVAPGNLRRSFFCASGSEANEGALLAATLHSGKHEFIAVDSGLHGRTKWAMSVTGLDMWRTDPSPVEGIHFVPAGSLAAIEEVIQRVGADRLAGMIAEPITGNGGIAMPPEPHWPAVRELLDRHGLLLIFDEVQTGMNRTGRWFACEHWNVVPDLLTTAKALGNGMPIAAWITSDKIAESCTRPGASTFGGNPVCAAAALATIEFHRRERLGERAAEQGTRLLHGLERIATDFTYLRDVRGKGLMVGVDLVGEAGAPDPQRMDDLLEALKERGILCGKTGPRRNVLTLMPPLIIETDQIDRLLNAICDSLTELERKGRHHGPHPSEQTQ